MGRVNHEKHQQNMNYKQIAGGGGGWSPQNKQFTANTLIENKVISGGEASCEDKWTEEGWRALTHTQHHAIGSTPTDGPVFPCNK